MLGWGILACKPGSVCEFGSPCDHIGAGRLEDHAQDACLPLPHGIAVTLAGNKIQVPHPGRSRHMAKALPDPRTGARHSDSPPPDRSMARHPESGHWHRTAEVASRSHRRLLLAILQVVVRGTIAWRTGIDLKLRARPSCVDQSGCWFCWPPTATRPTVDARDLLRRRRNYPPGPSDRVGAQR